MPNSVYNCTDLRQVLENIAAKLLDVVATQPDKEMEMKSKLRDANVKNRPISDGMLHAPTGAEIPS
jgi:hypothetical protein